MATKTKKKAPKTKVVVEPKPPDTKVEKFSASLRVDLSTAEIADRADRAAEMLAERDAKEEEHKAAAKHNKSVIEGLEAELRRLSYEVRTKSTYVPVECERRYIYAQGILKEIRLDSGECINERRLTEAECQLQLDFQESANGDGK